MKPMTEMINVAAEANRYICSGTTISRPITTTVIDDQMPKMTKAAQG